MNEETPSSGAIEPTGDKAPDPISVPATDAQPELRAEAGSGTTPETDPGTPMLATDSPALAVDSPTMRPGRRSGPPAWAGKLLLGLIPAVIVGLLVYFLAGAGGSSSGDNAPGIIDGFFRLGPSSGDSIQSFASKVPPGFPSQFPLYKDGDTIASFIVSSSPDDSAGASPTATTDQQTAGTNYFVILDTDATADQVYNFYLDALQKDPWQVEVARASDDFTGVQFSRPDDPNVEGDVSIHHSDLDNRTAVYVSIQDLSPDASSTPASTPFVLGPSRALPPNFPTDIPIYKGSKGDSVVTDTYFEKDPGTTSYIVSFLTKDGGSTVTDYYKSQFTGRGWTVTDSQSGNAGFAFSIDFTDGAQQQIQGTVRADTFPDDKSYTKVDLLLQVSSSRGRGN